MSARIRGGKKFRRFLRTAGKNSIKAVEIGFYSDATYPPHRKMGKRVVRVKRTPSVAEVAAWQTFGTKRKDGSQFVPPRPFMQEALKKVRRKLTDALRSYVDPRTMDITPEVGDILGMIVQSAIRDEITNLRSPALSPVTVELKGSTNPLIDTGLMRRSVTWKVIP